MSHALRVKNVSRDFVELGEDFILPGQVIELNATTDVLLNDALSDQLRLLVDRGELKVLADPPETQH